MHESGNGVAYTKLMQPLKLVYSEKHESRGSLRTHMKKSFIISHIFRIIKIALVIIVVLISAALFAYYGYFVDRFELEDYHCPVKLPDKYNHLSGLKIVFFADLHTIDSAKDIAETKKMVALINKQKPDIVVFAGDMMSTGSVEWRLPPARIISRLKDISSKYGIFAILGNHDWDYDGSQVISIMKKAGIQVLENDSRTIPGMFNIVGVADAAAPYGLNPEQALAKIDRSLLTIAIVHSPDYISQLPEFVSIVLSGHTHGGQIKLPYLGPMFLNTEGSAYCSGYYKERGRNLLVTKGIGTSGIRCRINVVSDITVVTIQQ